MRRRLRGAAADGERQLVGGDNQLRRLSLLRVEQAMDRAAPPRDGLPTIAHDADLRSALGLLLGSDAPALAVTRDGATVGTLSFENIRAETPHAALLARVAGAA